MRLALHWQILIAMVLGAVIGIVLNRTAGSYTADEFRYFKGGDVHLHGMSVPATIPPARIWVADRPSVTHLVVDQEIRERRGDADHGGPKRYVRKRYIVTADPTVDDGDLDAIFADIEIPDAPGEIERTQDPNGERVLRTVAKLADHDRVAYVLFHEYGRSAARTVGDLAKMLGDLFLRMLKMVSLPLIVTSLVTGITGLGQAERLGKMFGRTLMYYLATSLLAIVTGLIVFNVVDPGSGEREKLKQAADEAGPQEQQAVREGKRLPVVVFEQIESMIPTNPFNAIAGAKFLSVIAFSLAFGVCTILVGGHTAETISKLAEAAFHVMMQMTMIIIRFAPLGVFLLMLSATATQGIGVFQVLGSYMFTVACALFIHAVIVLPALLHFVANRNPAHYAEAMSPALLTAFSSASSNGTLPLTLTCVEERAGVSNRVASFVLPLGATINMDGTALYEVVAVMFIANLSGFDLSLADQIIIAFTALLASIGAAGIPHAGLVMMVIILQAVDIPTDKQGLIIAVDRVLDMCRTTVNVWSDSCGCAVVSKFEAGGGDPGKTPDPAWEDGP